MNILKFPIQIMGKTSSEIHAYKAALLSEKPDFPRRLYLHRLLFHAFIQGIYPCCKIIPILFTCVCSGRYRSTYGNALKL